MEVLPTTIAASSAQSAPPVGVRVLAGNLAAVPTGELLQAVVSKVDRAEATLTVNGQSLTVRPSAGLTPGAVLVVRVPAGGQATGLEVLGRAPAAAGTPLPTGTLLPATTPRPGGLPTTTGGSPPPGAVPVGTRPTGGATPTPTPTPTGTASVPPPAADATAVRPQVAQVEVLTTTPEGRLLVRIDGRAEPAITSEPLMAGGRYVMEVERTPAGAVLRSPTESPKLPADVAATVLRGTRPPDLGAVLKPLLTELATVPAAPTAPPAPGANPPAGPGRAVPVPPGAPVVPPAPGAPATPAASAVPAAPLPTTAGSTPAAPPVPGAPVAPETPLQQAAQVVRAAVRSFLPADGSPPNAEQLRNLVANGGLQYEAKLARIVESDDGANLLLARPTADASSAPRTAGPAEGPKPEAAKPEAAKPEAAKVEGPKPESAAARPAPADGARVSDDLPRPAPRPDAPADAPDLKAGLMRLLKAAHELGTVASFPAARAALDGIEAQQAANVLAREQGTPVVLQIPFPDRDSWRTLNLAVESDRPAGQDADEAEAHVRVLMHVPLSGLGETWIDAGLGGERFRAVLYLERSVARDRVRAELPALRTELTGEGFTEVLLDVRSAAELPTDRRKQAAAMRFGRTDAATVLDVRA
jgi:hypothetical protein